MSLFRKFQEVYYDAVRLREELNRIPSECHCDDPAAHLDAKCCCASSTPNGDAGARADAGCRAQLKQLLRNIVVLQHDLAQERRQLGSEKLDKEQARRLFIIENRVRALSIAGQELEVQMKQFAVTCAQPDLDALKQGCDDLQRYIKELDITFADDNASARPPDSAPELFHSNETKKSQAAEEACCAIEGTYKHPSGSLERLYEVIERHRVCYEVWNEYSMVNGTRVAIGYELQLCGVNEHEGDDEQHFLPGCPHCRRTYEDMRQIAEWITPKEERLSRYEIQYFDNAWHIAPATRNHRREIVLTIKVLHRHDVNQPVDDCERLCLKEMRDKLAGLGVLEGKWHSEQSWREFKTKLQERGAPRTAGATP